MCGGNGEFGWTAATLAEELLFEDSQQGDAVLVEDADGVLVPLALVQHMRLVNGTHVFVLRHGVGALAAKEGI